MPKWDVKFDIQVQTQQPELIALIQRAYAFASVIRRIPIRPSRQDRIDALNILRAVRGTTGIEGAELTTEEVQHIMEAPPNKPVLPPNRRREEQEARNAEQVMYYVARQLSNNPDLLLTERLVCKLHEITTQNIDYPHNIPGKYRTWPVSAGTYVPPQDGDKIRRLMKKFISWFNKGAPTSWDPIVRAIVAHFYVVSIHPFGDGNGRTARAVESFLLYKAGINARGFYSLANYYYHYREEYVQYLDQVRFETGGDLTPFVLFALRGLAEELEAVHNEILREIQEITFRDFAREQLQEKLATKSGERMINFILDLGNRSVQLKDIYHGKDVLATLYRNLTPKTLFRDLVYLRKRELITVDNGVVRANIGIMSKFVPPYELTKAPFTSTELPAEKTEEDRPHAGDKVKR